MILSWLVSNENDICVELGDIRNDITQLLLPKYKKMGIIFCLQYSSDMIACIHYGITDS